MRTLLLLSSFFILFSFFGCGSSGNGSYPLVLPPVKAATPAGLQAARSVLSTGRDLDSANFKSRFFSDGPTNIFNILSSIDTRITEINGRTTTTKGCSAQAPVSYTVTAFGETVTMYASCYEIISRRLETNPGLLQWGTKDGAFYLYSAQGAVRSAVIATPITGTSNYNVKAWMAVGYTNSTCGTTNTWDGCSYAVMRIDADSNASTFEMSVAGMGIGFCGAQLKSDGTNIYAAGSADGVGKACNANDTICADASTLATTPGACTALTTFTLPGLGRQTAAASTAVTGTWDASSYPTAGGNVLLDGTATDALTFGPVTPTTGVTAF